FLSSSLQPPPPTLIYTLSLHDALPIYFRLVGKGRHQERRPIHGVEAQDVFADHVHDLGLVRNIPPILLKFGLARRVFALKSNSQDRKSTRLNSSHVSISYAVFCLKKKK